MTEATVAEPVVADLSEILDAGDAASTTVNEPNPKYAAERELHGDESLCQLFGHLAADATVFEKEGNFPAVTGRIAVNNGEGRAPAYISFWVRPVKESKTADDSTRPSSEEMREVADSLMKGQRLKLRGKIEVRPLGSVYDEATDKVVPSPLYKELITRLGLTEEEARQDALCKAFFYASDTSQTLWMRNNELDIAGNANKKSRNPITLLPNIGEESTDRNDF